MRCKLETHKWWDDIFGSYEAEEINVLNALEPSPARRKNGPIGDGKYEVSKAVLCRNNIPVWCTMRNDKLVGVDRVQATHVLGHVTYHNSTGVSGLQAMRIGNENVIVTVVPCEDFWLCYVCVTTPAAILPPKVRQALSVAYSRVDYYDYSDFTNKRHIARWFGIDKSRITHAHDTAPPFEGEFPRSVVSAEHHTHFRPEEVWQVATEFKYMKRAMSVVLRELRRIEGVTEAVVSTFLLYVLLARPQIAYLLATSRRVWDVSDVGALAERLKSLSIPLKSLHNGDILDCSQLFELHTLINRGLGGIDWDAERDHRVRPNAVEVSPSDVYKQCIRLFKRGKSHGYRYIRMSRKKYIAARWEWCPAGSVHSQYDNDQAYIKKNYRHRTKFVTLNMMHANHIEDMFERKPQIRAWASTKYEWAKQRAIYGVDLTSSVITNFAMYRCEEALRHHFPVGEEAEAGRVHKRLQRMLSCNESLCYDFDDFNAQHSTLNMQMVLLAYRDTFQNDMHEEQLKAMDWVIASVADVGVYNNEQNRGEFYQTNGTLLSGWRLTTFMNTVLNYVYFKLSGALDVTGVVDSVHNGDDVLVAIHNMRAAVHVHERMAAINARAQATKCNVFSIGEFLRVEHKITKEDGMGAQYLTRGCATLAHSRIESQAPTRFIEAVKAMSTRCGEAISRGTDARQKVARLLDMAVHRLEKIFGVSSQHAQLVLRNHVLTGGIITDETGEVETLLTEQTEYEDDAELVDVSRMFEKARVEELNPGIHDYAQVLARQYQGIIGVERSISRIMSATRRQLAITRKTWLQTTYLGQHSKYKYGRALFGLYRELINIPHVEKARFVGISPIALLDTKGVHKIANLIRDVEDVEYTLRALL